MKFSFNKKKFDIFCFFDIFKKHENINIYLRPQKYILEIVLNYWQVIFGTIEELIFRIWLHNPVLRICWFPKLDYNFIFKTVKCENISVILGTRKYSKLDYEVIFWKLIPQWYQISLASNSKLFLKYISVSLDIC